MDFIVWNDLERYPDLPAGKKGAMQRSVYNEFAIRRLAYPMEGWILLTVWKLLYDNASGTATLLRLKNPLVKEKSFAVSEKTRTELKLIGSYLDGYRNRISDERNKVIAHNILDYENWLDNPDRFRIILGLVPKVIYLVELITEGLGEFTYSFDNLYTVESRWKAGMLHHSEPDDLVQSIFLYRSKPEAEFGNFLENALAKIIERERSFH